MYIRDLVNYKKDELVSLTGMIRSLDGVDTTGKTYSQTNVILEDLTGELRFVVWKSLEDTSKLLTVGDIYTINGKVDIFNGNHTLKFSSSTQLPSTEENLVKYDINKHVVKGITEDGMAAFMYAVNNLFDDVRYKRYAEVLFGLGELPNGISIEDYTKRFEDFKKGWAAKKHHDNYSGGLLMHYAGMLRIFNSLKTIYGGPTGPRGRNETRSTICWDQILLGIFYHDIEKLIEYISSEDNKSCEYNSEMKVNHIIRGISKLDAIDREIEPEFKLTFKEMELLKYTILSHHGSFGAFPVVSEEDAILHSIDVLDASNVKRLIYDIVT